MPFTAERELRATQVRSRGLEMRLSQLDEALLEQQTAMQEELSALHDQLKELQQPLYEAAELSAEHHAAGGALPAVAVAEGQADVAEPALGYGAEEVRVPSWGAGFGRGTCRGS